MKFSVLIPVYNTEKYLDLCIQSVINQTYKDFEIVLVDDGSTDSSGVICDKYQTDYPDIIKVIHQKNSGQLASRINAIKNAFGEYCLFLDSDDLLVNNAIEKIYETVVSNSCPEMIVYPIFSEREGDINKSWCLYDDNKFFQPFEISDLQKCFFTGIQLNSMCTKAIKRDVLLKSIFDYKPYSSLRCAEDRLQSMWILDNIHSAYYLNIPLYQYRLFEGSTTRTYSLNNIEKYNMVILYSEEKKYLLKWGLDTNEWLECFQAHFITYLVYVFDLFYMNVKKEEKTKVLNYDWHSFIPDEIFSENIENNGFIPDLQKIILSWILAKDERKIKRYYTRKKSYQKLRKIKRQLIGKK